MLSVLFMLIGFLGVGAAFYIPTKKDLQMTMLSVRAWLDFSGF